MTKADFKTNYCHLKRHVLKSFEGEDKVFREAETNKIEVKQTKNLGYEGGKEGTKKKKKQLCHCVEEELHRGSGRSQLLFKRGQSIPQGTISALQRGAGQKSP